MSGEVNQIGILNDTNLRKPQNIEDEDEVKIT